jgi:alpha-beta hydrolase superfamily lysophospholipase
MMFLNLPDPAGIDTPLLVMGAENDTIFIPKEIERTAKAYNTVSEILPDMAHDMMLEPGWQRAADRIIEWLSEKGL